MAVKLRHVPSTVKKTNLCNIKNKPASIEVVRTMKKLLMEKGWTTKADAKDNAGYPVHGSSRTARSFSVTGAFERSMMDAVSNKRMTWTETDELSLVFRQVTYLASGRATISLQEFNDNIAFKKSDVIALLDIVEKYIANEDPEVSLTDICNIVDRERAEKARIATEERGYA